jgi:hypothetical protein
MFSMPRIVAATHSTGWPSAAETLGRSGCPRLARGEIGVEEFNAAMRVLAGPPAAGRWGGGGMEPPPASSSGDERRVPPDPPSSNG